ncbi:ABC transporter permease [Aurantimonas sp. Leaf443]|nr:ABC transporter permease [Aurantimonas sp. Leaf443]
MLLAPIAAGLLGTMAPAFGYLPALGGTALSLGPWRSLLAEPGLGTSLALSVSAGLLAPLLSLAVVLAYLAAKGGHAPRGLSLALAMPHAAAAFALAFLVAPSGLLFRLAAPFLGLTRPPDLLILSDPLGLSLLAGLVVKEVPFLLFMALAALPQADAARRLALARSLGYGRMAGFALCVWPALYRRIRLPVLAVAAFSSSVVDVALVLGPSVPAPLGVRVLELAADPDLSRRFVASAGALLQLLATLLVLALWLLLERVAARLRDALAARGRRGAREALALRFAPLPLRLCLLALALGLGTLLVWSVARAWPFPALWPPRLDAGAWARLPGDLGGAAATTLIVAFASAGAALVLAVALLEAARRGGRAGPGDGAPSLAPALGLLVYLPLLVPQVAFVFGLKTLAIVLGAEPTRALLVLAHLLFVLPYAVLVLEGPWRGLDPRYERLAAGLGRSPRAALWRLRLPMLAVPLVTAFATGFAVSVGLYLPTILIGAGRLPTLATQAVALASGGERRLVAVTALALALPAGLAFLLAALAPALLWRRRRGMRAP